MSFLDTYFCNAFSLNFHICFTVNALSLMFLQNIFKNKGRNTCASYDLSKNQNLNNNSQGAIAGGPRSKRGFPKNKI